MIIGTNTSLEHQGQTYHIQCEDLGVDLALFEIRVYSEGTILWQKRIPYDPKLEGMDRLQKDEALRDQMAKLVKTVKAAILQGKIKRT